MSEMNTKIETMMDEKVDILDFNSLKKRCALYPSIK